MNKVKQDYVKERNRLLRLPGAERKRLRERARSQFPALGALAQKAAQPRARKVLAKALR